MEAVAIKHSIEEQKRLEELEEEEQRKDDRRNDYYKNMLKGSNKKKHYNTYIFTQEDLSNDDIISAVETIPTYKRTRKELESIQSKANIEEKPAVEPTPNDDSSDSQIIRFF